MKNEKRRRNEIHQSESGDKERRENGLGTERRITEISPKWFGG
jgi:hypothetical protein